MTDRVFKINLNNCIAKYFSNNLSRQVIKNLINRYFDVPLIDDTGSKFDFIVRYLEDITIEDILSFIDEIKEDDTIKSFAYELLTELNSILSKHALKEISIPSDLHQSDVKKQNDIFSFLCLNERKINLHSEVVKEVKSQTRKDNFDKINELIKNIFPYIEEKFGINIDTSICKEKDWISKLFGANGLLQLDGSGKSKEDKNRGFQLIVLGCWDLIRNDLSHTTSKLMKIDDNSAAKYYELISSVYYWIDNCKKMEK